MKTIGFFGAEKFFMNESNSEREHYNKLEAFMNRNHRWYHAPKYTPAYLSAYLLWNPDF